MLLFSNQGFGWIAPAVVCALIRALIFRNEVSILYFVGIVGGIGALCAYAFIRSIIVSEWEQAFMIFIFALIIVGGLIGLGIDISNGYAFDPLSNK